MSATTSRPLTTPARSERKEKALRVVFIGPGNIGRGIVHRLLAQGHEVVVSARSRERVAELLDAGAGWTDSIHDAAQSADAVLSCLVNPEVARRVLLDDGVIAAGRPGQVFMEHGTFPPELAEEFDAAARAVGARFVDCPVSGGPEGALNGTLSLMAGGDPDAFERVRPLLEGYGREVVHLGPAGSGQKLKLINQILVVGHTMAAAEAAAVVLGTGLDPEAALKGLRSGWAQSTMLERNLPRTFAADFADSGATIGAMADILKEVDAFLRGQHAQTPVFDSIHAAFDEAVARGQRDDDLAGMVKPLLATKGGTPRPPGEKLAMPTGRVD